MLDVTTLPATRKDLIDAVHFYLYPVILLVFGAGFVVKAYRIQFVRERRDEQ